MFYKLKYDVTIYEVQFTLKRFCRPPPIYSGDEIGTISTFNFPNVTLGPFK